MMSLILFAILFAGVLQGIILVVLLMLKQPNRLSNRILATLVSILVIHLSLVALDIRHLFLQFPHLSRLSWLIPLCYGPLMLLFTKSIMIRGFSIKPRYGLYFLPFVIYLFVLLPYYFQPASAKLPILADPLREAKADFGLLNGITNYIHILFASACLYIYYRKRAELPDYFADADRARFSWLETFLWSIWAIMLFSWICFMAKRFDWPVFSGVYPTNFLLAVALIYWISYKLLLSDYRWDQPAGEEGAGQLQPAVNLTQTDQIQVKYQKTALSPEEITAIKGQLLVYMTKEKPFLDPSLTIEMLAGYLGVKRHQLSQVINQEFGQNFFEFTNSYRIAEFKKQATRQDAMNLSILGLAFDCGFNSKATFNQVFKKHEGITPSAFLKQLKG